MARFRSLALGSARLARHDDGKVGDDGLPIAVDWRKRGAVAQVQNQGQVGTYWAFAAAAAIEGLNKIVTGELIKVSEQQLIDCNCITSYGCRSGFVASAFDYVIRNGGIVESANYPYVACQHPCQRIMAPAVTVDDYMWANNATEDDLKWAVSRQPVCVLVYSGGEFSQYKGGILDGPNYSYDIMNHCVTVIGYDSEDGQDYWTVKNSWGKLYGEGGYIRIARGTGGALGIIRSIIMRVKWSPNRICAVKSDADMGLKQS